MGYEVTRFTHKIDEEFHCSICAMVLKDAMQSPCEHLFCNECIRGWLAVDESCPVERGPLKLEDVKPAPRVVRNFVNKFQIKCDFESKGCEEILKLQDLGDHVGKCEYNMVICDKGCNVEMYRQEYETKNCFRHLADQAVCQQETILKLNDELSLQNEKIEKLINEVTSLRRQQEDYDDKSEVIEALNDEIERLNNEALQQIRSREDEFVKLNEEICGLRRQIEQRENEIKVLVNGPEFRVLWGYGKMSIEQNVLQVDGDWRYAQSVNPLEPTKFSVKFEILSMEVFIGLGPMCSSDDVPNLHAAYKSEGHLNFGGKIEKVGPAWKVGDIIECGINFPCDFVNDGRDVRVYFNQNGKFIGEQLVEMPIDGLFPTVFIRGGSKIKYLSD